MQLAISRYISRWTDIKVIFNGDVIDEARILRLFQELTIGRSLSGKAFV